ncbi:Bud site selection protein bud4, partial [Ascosphaera aggregata]
MSKRSRQFWKGKDTPPRDQENTSNTLHHHHHHHQDSDGIILSSKKHSIENLKKAERVTNVKSSTMFAASELTPPDSIRSKNRSTDRPMVTTSRLRPSTTTTTHDTSTNDINININNNANYTDNTDNAATTPATPAPTTTTTTSTSSYSSSPSPDARLLLPSQRNNPTTATAAAALIGRPSLTPPSTNSSQQATPSTSPTKTTFPLQKSSISRNGRYSGKNTHTPFASKVEPWSESTKDDTSLERQQKSVTFDDAPPQVNEYEMATPAPSSTSSVHDGSYDSDDFDDEESFERGSSVDMEDSFDASLEDTQKTPVVLPDEWRFMNPDDDDDDDDHDDDDDEDDNYDDESTEMGDESLADHDDSQHTQTTASSHLNSFDSATER